MCTFICTCVLFDGDLSMESNCVVIVSGCGLPKNQTCLYVWCTEEVCTIIRRCVLLLGGVYSSDTLEISV